MAAADPDLISQECRAISYLIWKMLFLPDFAIYYPSLGSVGETAFLLVFVRATLEKQYECQRRTDLTTIVNKEFQVIR
jgi:hypothetical protein